MASDGTLAEIINQEIFNELNEKIDTAMKRTDNQSYNDLTLDRQLRYFIQTFNNPLHTSGNDNPYLQGGTYTGSDKIIIINLMFIKKRN